MGTIEMLSRRLRELRENAGLSQAQLAEELSVSRGSISYYENGERTPDVDFLMRAKAFFCVDYEYLLGESAIKNHRDRTSIEAAIEHLPDTKKNSIFHFVRLLIQCAELYEGNQSLEEDTFFERLTADITTYVEAYTDIIYDSQKYDDRTVMLRFLDRTIHTNVPHIIYSISRHQLLKELQDIQSKHEAEEGSHGLNQKTDH